MNLKKTLSIIVVICMLSFSIMNTIAANNHYEVDNLYEDLGECIPDYEKEIREKKKTSEEFEVVSLREETVKHFAKSDGTIKAVVYPFPVHKLNEQDEWEDLYCSGQTTEFDCYSRIVSRTENDFWVNGHEHYDTYISQYYPNTNYMFDDYLIVSSNQIAYFYCTNPEIPQNATVVGATLTYRYWYNSNLTSGNAILGIYEALTSWDPFELTYNNSGTNFGLSTNQITSESLTISNGINSLSPGSAIFDITDLSLQWYAGKQNNGIGIKYIGGNLSSVILCSNDCFPFYPTYSVNYTIDDLIVDNGYYFIYNLQLERFLQIDPDAQSQNQDQAYLEVWSLDGDNDQQWYVRYLHNGYYRITSKASNKSLAIKSGGENSNGTRIVQESFTLSDRQQWAFSTSSRGYVTIRPKSSNNYPSNDWVMTTAFGVFNGDGREVVQYVYSDNNDLKDEWLFGALNFSAKLTAFNESIFHPRNYYFTETKKWLNYVTNMKTDLVSTYYFSNSTESEMLSFLTTNNIFVVHAHGNQTFITIGDATYLGMVDLNGVDLSDLKFALLLTCYAAKDYDESHIYSQTPEDFVEKMVVCGAETVIGFTGITTISDCNSFATQLFKNAILYNMTIEEAINAIDYTDFENNMYSMTVIAGNKDLLLRQ